MNKKEKAVVKYLLDAAISAETHLDGYYWTLRRELEDQMKGYDHKEDVLNISAIDNVAEQGSLLVMARDDSYTLHHAIQDCKKLLGE